MTESTATDPNLGRVLAGQFRIDALLGQGGMGMVYRGVQLSVNRAVAIKLITGSAPNQAELVQRFRREAEATARLSHPNTVRLFDFGVTDSQELYMVMELLTGSDLSVHLQEGQPLPLTEALQITRQVLQALSEAHALGVVHRDLKPGNVFLARVHGGEIVAKVMDFGIAGIEQARETQKLTMTGAVLGTPAYMSPEQAQGLPVDVRSDLYSLGVMLFEMLTGRPPFEADTVVSLLLAHVTKPPPRLADMGPSFPQLAAAQSVLDHLLAKTPEQRFASAAAALEAIDALAAGSHAPVTPASRAAGFAPTAFATPASPETPLGWTLSQTPTTERSASRRPRIAGLLIGAALLTAAGLAIWRGRTPAPNPPPSAASSAAPEPAAALRSVTIASSPKGASVLLNGAELGKTPYTLQFRRATALKIVLSGYAPQTITVTPESDPNLTLELVPQRRTGVIAEAIAPRKSGEAPATARDVPATETGRQRANAQSEPIVHESTARESPPPPPVAATPRRTPIREVTRAVGGLVGSIFGRDDQRTRREGMLRGAPPFPSVAAAQRAYSSGRIGADAYEDAVWVLKARRKQRIDAEKANLKRGVITPQEYEWRLGRIDAEFQGQ
jgi:serine/threonine-protein kinase